MSSSTHKWKINPFEDETSQDVENLGDTRTPSVQQYLKRKAGAREKALKRYGHCPITGYHPKACDVSHLVPVQYGGSDKISNLVLTRSDINRALDSWAMTISTDGVVIVHEDYLDTPWGTYLGHRFHLKADHRAALLWHNKFFSMEPSERATQLKAIKEKLKCARLKAASSASTVFNSASSVPALAIQPGQCGLLTAASQPGSPT